MAALELVRDKFGVDVIGTSEFRDNVRIVVGNDRVYDVLAFLKQSGFDLLVDITCVDYLHYPDARDRFGVVYCLANIATAERIVVKTHLNDPELSLPSVFPLWKGADWLEREVFDLFGITFDGHPDLRRILMPEEFVSFPLRKDYPLRGKHERHNFPALIRADG